MVVLGNAPDSDANITVRVDQSLKFMVEESPALYALISDAQLHCITLGLLSVVVHYFSKLLRHLQFTLLHNLFPANGMAEPSSDC